MNGKYMTYVGSYSYTGKTKGITVYDVDVEKGVFKERCEVEVDNSSHVIASDDGKTLYPIADEGVVPFHILQDGNLARLGSSPIRDVRDCHLCTDVKDKHVSVSGYRDGKATVLSLNKDDSMGGVIDEVYNKSCDSMAEQSFRSHVIRIRGMSDSKYVLFVGNGTGQIEAHQLNDKDKKLVQADVIYCDLELAPRHFRYNSDGRFPYLMYELQNVISVYSYEAGDRASVIGKIQTISITATKNPGNLTAACAMRLSLDEKYIYCTDADENTVTICRRDEESGLLTVISCLPVGGEYPKDVAVFLDQKHIASISHDSGSISFFEVNYRKGLLVMCGRSINVNQPNCCAIARIDRSQQGT